MTATKTAYFEPEYLALRERLLTRSLIAGDKTEHDRRTSGPR